ncbi:MAG: protein-L-isoaspartate O-methyltransferase [Comamonadaceae bacterium]|nr:MAG: protein-L-isoaspartate O-methyltransferase [Comamonadaceae bacterium]
MSHINSLEHARFNMIEQQIRPWDVLDQGILQLLSVVKREDFVPLAHKALAFVDMEIPLQNNGAAGQSMLAPRVEARMLQEMKIQPDDKVLEIGTGSGYMAALLAHRAAHVTSFEIDGTLARIARENLQKAGVTNVEVIHADGASARLNGPFDVIVLSGSADHVPDALLAQLKPGGRLGAIIGDEPIMRATVVVRAADGTDQITQPWDTVAPRLLNFPQPSRFSF